MRTIHAAPMPSRTSPVTRQARPAGVRNRKVAVRSSPSGAQGAERQRGERHHGGRSPGLGGQRPDLPVDLGPLPQGGRHAVHRPRRRTPRRHGHGQGPDHEADAGTGAALRPAVEGDTERQAPVDVDQHGGEIVGRHRARGRSLPQRRRDGRARPQAAGHSLEQRRQLAFDPGLAPTAGGEQGARRCPRDDEDREQGQHGPAADEAEPAGGRHGERRALSHDRRSPAHVGGRQPRGQPPLERGGRPDRAVAQSRDRQPAPGPPPRRRRRHHHRSGT